MKQQQPRKQPGKHNSPGSWRFHCLVASNLSVMSNILPHKEWYMTAPFGNRHEGIYSTYRRNDIGFASQIDFQDLPLQLINSAIYIYIYIYNVHHLLGEVAIRIWEGRYHMPHHANLLNTERSQTYHICTLCSTTARRWLCFCYLKATIPRTRTFSCWAFWDVPLFMIIA